MRPSLHALLQQLTAILLIPLSLWLARFLIRHAADADLWQRALSESWTPFLLGLFLVVASFHAALGMETIVDDYIDTVSLKRWLLWGSRLGLLAVVALALLALIML